MLFKRRKNRSSTAQDDRRRHQRQNEELDLEITLKSSDGTTWPIQLIDLSMGGLRLRFPVHKRPELAPNDRVYLRLSGQKWTADVKINARVAWYMRDTLGHWYAGVEFDRRDELERQVDIFNQSAFTRRRSPRVELPWGSAVRAVISWDGHELKPAVNDVSVIGLGVKVSQAHAELLEDVDRLSVELWLPKNRDSFCSEATIENRIPIVKHVLLGLDFDFRGSEGQRLLEALRVFIERRSKKLHR